MNRERRLFRVRGGRGKESEAGSSESASARGVILRVKSQNLDWQKEKDPGVRGLLLRPEPKGREKQDVCLRYEKGGRAFKGESNDSTVDKQVR